VIFFFQNFVSETLVFNFLYMIGLFVFFFSIFMFNSKKLNKRTFKIYQLIILTNPFTLAIITQNHVEYFACILLATSFIFIHNNEYDLAIVFYFIAHNLYPIVLKFSFLTIFILIAMKIYKERHLNYYAFKNYKTIGKILFLYGIYIGIFAFIIFEFDKKDLGFFKDNYLSNIYYNFHPFMLIV